jgi:hypothetical protein
MGRQFLAVYVGHIGSEHQTWFVFSGDRLEIPSRTDSELDRIGRSINNRPNCGSHILNAAKKADFIKEAMIDGDIETFTICCHQAA